jgi:Tfp pilus assembly protein PilF
LACLLPLTAEAARSCDEWSAEISAVEGRAEVRRDAATGWTALGTGDRVCSGDSLRTLGASRVTITLPDHSTLRLDEQSTLILPEPDSGGSLIDLIRGVIHVISRDPRLLRFTTPYANAGLEGTEFDIRVDERARLTEIVVLEGEVLVTTPAGELEVATDHVAVAREGQAPTATPYATPIERMRWASHYPAIVDGPLPAVDEEPRSRSADFFARRAAARLETARIAAAEDDLDTAVALAPRHATAHALQALLALARADRVAARELVERALAADSTSVEALLAQSYVEQSSGQIAAARRAISHALALDADNALVLTRQAELALAAGDTSGAIDAATRARTLAPMHSTPLVVLGFASLRAYDVDAATRAFEGAVEQEPYAPLARLGLALALLQGGDSAAGREQLELAVTLDPANPLTRSYVAKVYEAENRSALTATQLELAKEFDPGDPTPWLYSALRRLRGNSPVAALHELRLATEKNNDVPVFRSSFSLDEDAATRSAGLGRVHTELGFGRLALLDAWQSVSASPADYAGHRLLADVYATEPRHEIARVSELTVSQLLQPANLTPIKPQLAQPNLFIAQRAGPSPTSYDELDSPLVANGLKLRASAAAGDNGTGGTDVTLAGLHDDLSYSIGYYGFATDGFRPNNDLDQRVGNAFLQWRPSAATSLQAELRSVSGEQGDLTMRFNRDFYLPTLRSDESADSLRFGVKQELSGKHVLLGSVIVQDVTSSNTDTAFAVGLEQQGHTLEVQHIRTSESVTLQSGFVVTNQDETLESRLSLPGRGPVVDMRSNDLRRRGLYSYVHFNPSSGLTLTAGLSVDDIEMPLLASDAVDPKLSVAWRPTERTTVRAAAFETLFGSLTTSTQNVQPTLEPAQLSGFTQLLVAGTADEADVRGIGVDHELSGQLSVGWQAELRDLDRVVLNLFAPGPYAQYVTLHERAQQAYLYWTPLDRVSISARYERGRYRSDSDPLFGYTQMELARMPLELRYFARGGLTAGLRAARIAQNGVFQVPSPAPPPGSAPPPVPLGPSLAPGADRFWIFDAFVGYRLPRRRGLLSLNADNLLDERFQFQDIDPTNTSLIPERMLSARFTLAFD